MRLALWYVLCCLLFFVRASSDKRKGVSVTKQPKILIVEDDEKLSFVLREMFQAEGYQVRTASSGTQGVRGYLLFDPDFVLADVEMPEASGLEMMSRIRVYDPHAKVIYMTGDVPRFQAQLKDEMRIHEALVISKPFSQKDLFQLIEEDSQSDRMSLP